MVYCFTLKLICLKISEFYNNTYKKSNIFDDNKKNSTYNAEAEKQNTNINWHLGALRDTFAFTRKVNKQFISFLYRLAYLK